MMALRSSRILITWITWIGRYIVKLPAEGGEVEVIVPRQADEVLDAPILLA
jgi:hypothetical protein